MAGTNSKPMYGLYHWWGTLSTGLLKTLLLYPWYTVFVRLDILSLFMDLGFASKNAILTQSFKSHYHIVVWLQIDTIYILLLNKDLPHIPSFYYSWERFGVLFCNICRFGLGLGAGGHLGFTLSSWASFEFYSCVRLVITHIPTSKSDQHPPKQSWESNYILCNALSLIFFNPRWYHIHILPMDGPPHTPSPVWLDFFLHVWVWALAWSTECRGWYNDFIMTMF